MAVPTGLTAQDTTGIRRNLPAFPNVVAEQINVLLSDLPADIIKLGMLGTDDVLIRVASTLERYPTPRIVDPVLQASDGAYLLERRAWNNLIDLLIAGAALVTPNLPEAKTLTGSDDPEEAARLILGFGAQAVLVKGGHADGEPNDFFLSGTEGTWFPGKRQDVGNVHGTGCALSSAIAARMARGETLRDAIPLAKEWLAGAIASSEAAGAGARLLKLSGAA